MTWLMLVASDPSADVAASKPVVIAAIVFAVLVVFFAGGEKISGPFYRILATRRRAASDKDDADIAQLKRQVANLEAQNKARDAKAIEHSEWDNKAAEALARLGENIGPPPSLY